MFCCLYITDFVRHVKIEYAQIEYAQIEYAQIEYAQIEYAQIKYAHYKGPLRIDHGGHHFIVLNIPINNKPFFVSAAVVYEKLPSP